jgi:hypothetical protein
MDANSLARVERLNYIIGTLLIVLCAVLTDKFFSLGAAAGVVITCLNFAIIRRLVDKLLELAPDERSKTALFFAPKMVGLLVIVTLVLFFLPISAVGFAIGFSIFFLSIMIESVRFMSGSTLSH